MLRSGCNGFVLNNTTTNIDIVIIDVVKLREGNLTDPLDMADLTDWRTWMSWEWRQGHGCP